MTFSRAILWANNDPELKWTFETELAWNEVLAQIVRISSTSHGILNVKNRDGSTFSFMVNESTRLHWRTEG